MNARQVIELYWRYANARQWDDFSSLLDPNVVYEVPQTRERVQGREGYRDFNVTYPEGWTAVVTSLISEGDQGVSVIDFNINGKVATGISFFTLSQGLITKIVDYWPEEYEPPHRNTKYVERF